jgi:hypothetical protein
VAGPAGPLPYVFQTSVADKVAAGGDTAVQRSNKRLTVIAMPGPAREPLRAPSSATRPRPQGPAGCAIQETTGDA